MKPLLILVALLLPVSVIATGTEPVYETGFNCEKAFSKIERMICSSGELAKLDLRLTRIYVDLLASSANREAVKARQRQWLATVRNTCSDAVCLRNSYEKRIRELRPPLVISDRSSWHEYIDRGAGVAFYYPKEMTVLASKQAEFYYFVSLIRADIRITFPAAALWGGNLSAASVSIEKNSDGCHSFSEKPPAPQTSHYETKTGVPLPPDRIVSINGVTFHETYASSAATGGNFIDGTLFETIHNGRCFSVMYMVETQTSQEPVTEPEEVQKIKDTLMQVIKSLKFLRN